MSGSTSRSLSVFLLLVPVALACRNQAPSGSQEVAATASRSTPSAAPTVDSAAAPVPDSTPVAYQDAERAFERRSYGEAEQLFSSYRRQHPDNAWGHYMYGLSAWKAGQPTEALAGFDEALQLDPDHRKSLFNSARVLLETGRPEQALERIERGLGLEPLSAEGHRLLGRARVELGQFPEAIEAYERAIAIDDRDAWSMNNLGLLYIQQGRSDDALGPLARAAQLRPNSPVFQNNLGTALEQSGHYAEAKSAYEAAVAADSSYAKAVASLERVGTLVQPGDKTNFDVAEVSREYQAELSRSHDVTGPTDSVTVQASVEDTTRDSSTEQ
jgi:tetratricopeptide (TPR) repeat protein